MKIVFATDSYKGSLSAGRMCNIGEKIALEIFPDCKVEKVPMADGGEGTVDALNEILNGEIIECNVKDPLLRNIKARYCKIEDTAIIEMSSTSGITLVENENRNVLIQNTYGTGQLILDAVEKGVTKIYIGIGGSATNDGGIGFASAIGVKFLDENKNEIEPLPINFQKIKGIDISNINKKVLDCEINVLCDVENPLLGENGATNVFGKQKGADLQTRNILEKGMTHYINIAEEICNNKVRYEKGSGAAGGLGAGLRLFTKAKMCSGIETILNIVNFKDRIYDASLVITGEGKIDFQSAYGKVVCGVGKACKEQNIPCIALVGSIGEKAEEMYNYGIDSIISIINSPMSLSDAVKNSEELYEKSLRNILKAIKVGMQYLP